MHNSYKKTIYGVRAALENMAQGVDESTKYHIPEDIPQNERTAFHGAAAAAAKSGKKSFNFGGKTHPVTMKKDTANAIADQKESVKKEATHTTDYFTGHKHAARAGMKVKVHSKGADGDNVTVSHADPKKLQKYVDNHLGGGKIKEAAGIPHKYTVDLYHKDHGSHDSFIKKAKSAGIKGAYSGVNKDGKVKVSLNHHDNSDGGTIHKFLKKHYDKNMTHGNMQTMKTGSSSQKEDTMNEEFSKTNKASMTIKHGYDEGDGPDNKKFAKYINKNTGATVKHHKDGSTMSFHGSDHQIHKALQIHHSDDKKGLGDLNYHKKGKTHSDDHVDGQHSYKAEGTTFREKLMSVLEGDKASHYKGATKPEPMPKDDEHGAKKMKAGHPIKKDDHEETSTAAEKSTKPSKMRGNDNKQGDKNIMPSATKDTPANKTVKEKFDSLLKAYSVVQEYTHEFDVDHNHLKKVMSAAKKNGIKAKVHTMKGPGGGNPVVHLGHKDTDTMHKFVKKHYDPDYKKSDLNMHKL